MKQTSVFLVLLLLSACGPIYETRYDFTPPRDERGRSCTYSCETMRQSCTSMQRQTQWQCERMAEQQESLCESQIRWSEGREPKWYECSRPSCTADEEMCNSQYRACYQGCGGDIRSYQVCTMNCDQIQPKADENIKRRGALDDDDVPSTSKPKKKKKKS